MGRLKRCKSALVLSRGLVSSGNVRSWHKADVGGLLRALLSGVKQTPTHATMTSAYDPTETKWLCSIRYGGCATKQGATLNVSPLAILSATPPCAGLPHAAPASTCGGSLEAGTSERSVGLVLDEFGDLGPRLAAAAELGKRDGHILAGGVVLRRRASARLPASRLSSKRLREIQRGLKGSKGWRPRLSCCRAGSCGRPLRIGRSLCRPRRRRCRPRLPDSARARNSDAA